MAKYSTRSQLVELRTPRGVEPQRARLCLFSCTAGSARSRGSKMGTGVAFFIEQAAPSTDVHGGLLARQRLAHGGRDRSEGFTTVGGLVLLLRTHIRRGIVLAIELAARSVTHSDATPA